MDAQKKAKSKGANVVKQWDSTLDGATRDTHRLLDGQIREVDEPFEVEGKKADAPGMFNDPAEDCNCRCCLLQRARWALDDKELDTLKERAEYFGLDKSKDFEDFKEKYLKASNTSYEGIPKTWGELPKDADIINVNPNRKTDNCVNCSIAYEMRMRNKAVVAGESNKTLRKNPFSGWVNPEPKKADSNNPITDISEHMRSWGDGSRAQLVFTWKRKQGIYSNESGEKGHSIVAVQKGKDTIFIDAQSKKVYTQSEINEIFELINKNNIQYCRIDVLDISDVGVSACRKESP